MSHERKPPNHNELSDEQSKLMQGFVDRHIPDATLGPQEVSYYEQSSAHLRDGIRGFGCDLTSTPSRYGLMAGLSISTVWMEGLMHHGLTADQAGRVMRVSLASILSEGDKLKPRMPELDMTTEEPLDPRVAETLKPEETAIIVVDVMDGYCDPEAPLPKALNATTEALDKAADKMVSFLDTSRRYPIGATVFARMIERPDTAPANLRLKMEVDEAPAVAEIDGVGWNYYKVQPQEGDHEIIKYSYDSFMGTDLDEYLKARGIKTVVIMGGYASVCVETTARTAAQLGYNTFVPADLTADLDSPTNPQTPDMIRKKLDTINNVMGYMPLGSAVLEVWQDQN